MAKRPRHPARPRRRRPATILDVARVAGVSTATVSRSLASPERVSEPTRAAVFKAISEIGFTPNATARNLRARSTRMVLALLDGFGDRFYNVIMDAIDDVLTDAGYGIIYGASRHDPERAAHYARLVRSGQVDGVLLLTGALPEERLTDNSTVPFTLICNDIPGHPEMSLFAPANADAAAAMTAHLIGLGHTRIAHVTGPRGNIEARERLAGYRSALADAGLPFDPSIVWEGTFAIEAGVRAAGRFLQAADRPTAVFAANDEIAIGLIRALKDAGLSVPEDVSVAGYDDIEYAAIFTPALTTMRQPRAELGRRAAEDLVRRMAAAGAPPNRERLACSLVVRESVRSVGAGSRPEVAGGRAPSAARTVAGAGPVRRDAGV